MARIKERAEQDWRWRAVGRLCGECCNMAEWLHGLSSQRPDVRYQVRWRVRSILHPLDRPAEPCAWRVVGRQKTGGAICGDMARSRPLCHVSSTLRRGYPWQVASPQRLRPFHLADAPCHKLAANSIRQSPDLIRLAATNQPGINSLPLPISCGLSRHCSFLPCALEPT